MNHQKEQPKTIALSEVLDEIEKKSPGIKKSIENSVEEYIAIMKLKEVRLQNKLSQEELSKKSGISRDKISKIESGKQNVTIQTLQKLSSAMGKRIEIRFV